MPAVAAVRAEPQVLGQAAGIYRQQGKAGKAQDLYERAVALQTAQPNSPLNQGQACPENALQETARYDTRYTIRLGGSIPEHAHVLHRPVALTATR